MLGYWRWPVVNGEITEVVFERIPHRHLDRDTMRLVVAYKFSVSDDGPFTGETCWEPLYPTTNRLEEARDKFHIGQHVPVHFRPDNPSVNKLDRRTWQGL
jgi:hypothetical protein